MDKALKRLKPLIEQPDVMVDVVYHQMLPLILIRRIKVKFDLNTCKYVKRITHEIRLNKNTNLLTIHYDYHTISYGQISDECRKYIDDIIRNENDINEAAMLEVKKRAQEQWKNCQKPLFYE